MSRSTSRSQHARGRSVVPEPWGPEGSLLPVSTLRESPPRDFSDIRVALASGTLVDDRVFDDVYPLAVRRASAVYWTPVEVAVRVAKLLAPSPGGTILDIGAGVAKFCVVAAATVDATIRGVEQRPHFVDVGREAARKVGVRIDLVHGTLTDEDPARATGVYLFNPFGENLCPRSDHLDDTVELSRARYARDVAETEAFLARARVGTRVATYCGFGGKLPDDYVLLSRERCAGRLELWQKTEGYSRARASSGSA